MGYLLSLFAVGLLGYLAGLVSFKVKSRWCTECGTIKSCPTCARRAASAAGPATPVASAAPLDSGALSTGRQR